MIAVTVGGRTFSDPPAGGTHVLEAIGGWFDGVSVRGSDTARPQGHGSFGERAWRGSRLVTLTVSLLTGSHAEAADAQRWCAAMLGDGGYGELAVTDPSGETTTAEVRLGGMPLVRWFPQSAAIRAQFQLLAPDPLRYGPWQTATTTFPARMGGLRFPLYSDGAGVNVGALDYGEPSTTGRVLLSNPGTADSWAQFNVAGPVPAEGFEIVVVGTGRRIRFEGAVPLHSDLVIDTATGTAVIDGSADRGGLLTYRDWPPIPAGGSVEFAFIPLGPTSSAVLTASFRPPFW